MPVIFDCMHLFLDDSPPQPPIPDSTTPQPFPARQHRATHEPHLLSLKRSLFRCRPLQQSGGGGNQRTARENKQRHDGGRNPDGTAAAITTMHRLPRGDAQPPSNRRARSLRRATQERSCCRSSWKLPLPSQKPEGTAFPAARRRPRACCSPSS